MTRIRSGISAAYTRFVSATMRDENPPEGWMGAFEEEISRARWTGRCVGFGVGLITAAALLLLD